MGTKKGFVYISIGSVLAYFGMVQAWIDLDSIMWIIIWGLIACLGVIIIGFGIVQVYSDDQTETSPEPEGAPGKSDWPFDRF